ncbi:golgi apparatus membrane protein-like protein tvp23 [Cucurbitaria berberidis CBS 394.84]|uniref:Golgi apparatus membrane protein TVP23 n=1 Tax=Cucurbitaria berberidis CBS 394.84 TaxID=1168544 RepID=A0A9P4G731_9PLEO|nr:golgi apparatus membrane protein-like protein tvp23 [Cucurbitaria berberidis CBS 394.84]KAF1839934.1 golgi apparatus membrane protein-like protein tvp23 [Cucurbitaria berberidis CBS 394.84]
METAQQTPTPGSLSWRLSSHPITLITFLFFRISSLLVYLLGLRLLTSNFVLIFIITILLLAIDFYYLKNIAGRRLVGLRWWNEVDANTGDGRWVFESADPETREINATDKRFFWLALYAQPVLWVVLAVVALVSLEFIWLTLVEKRTREKVMGLISSRLGSGGKWELRVHAVIALVLTITNTLAFSRCDKFSQATGFASNAMYGSGLARNLAGGMIGSWFRR